MKTKKIKKNKLIKSSEKQVKKVVPKVFVPKTSNQVISYLFKDFDIETGIFKITDDEYSFCMEYTDVSFSKASDEEAENIFFKWLEYLHSFRENVHIEIINASSPVKVSKYKENFIFDADNTSNDKQKQIAKELNALITNTMGSTEKMLQVKRYIVISSKAKSFSDANSIFLNIFLKTEQKFKELKSKVRIVKALERIEFIYNFINVKPIFENNYGDIFDYIKEKNMTIFDFMAPKKISNKESDYIEIDDQKFIRVLYVNKLPKSLTPRFYNRITTLENVNMITTLNITPTNSAKMIKTVDKSLSAMETERLEKIKRAGKSNLDYEYVKDKKLETRIANAMQLQQDLQKNNQKIFQNNMLICIIANSYKELEEQTVKVMDIAAEQLVELKSLLWQQLEGIQHILPLGHNSIQFQRTLTSEATAVNVPFNTKDLLHPKSLFFGTNLVSKNAIFAELKTLINGHGCVLATSGAGKSFSVKTLIEQILLRYPEDTVCIIDPQNEFQGLLDVFEYGQRIVISATSNTYLNPFDLDMNYGLSEETSTSPVKSKAEYLIAFIESIVGANGISGEQKTIIDRCTKIIFEEFEKSNFSDKTKLPSLLTFYEELMKQPESEAHKLALVLERYVHGSLDIFSRETNVNINSRLVIFDISELPSSLQTTGYLVVLDHIYNRLAANKKNGRYTRLFIDEGHILLSHPYAAEYTAKINKVGRKFLCFNTFITQQVEEVKNNIYGRAILSNSEWALILKQKPLDLPHICNIFDISEEEAKYITGDIPSGQGILVYGSDKIPFSNRIPKDYLIYKVNNTDNQFQARQ